ncbi:glycosyltransferase involved in cell wall biosynthesis [Bacillus sp. SLBN-46]|uniref:glycosyltransferase family 4 protein n=1 Tax=Bacillus sp. SLBN-46 TaxID=3042283 RepID=UPI002854DC3A|nr:glycosyltransferase family 1 protein [Bacillus sp. SLBN-46]MDR6123329.1 glycosyltransferase involved in cell wall biosynthesis [Bacillus sp. SLBN-46]
MRIGINLLNFSQDRHGGVEQYVKNLIWHLVKVQQNLKLFLFITRPYRDTFPDQHEQIKRVIFKDVKNPVQIHEAIHQYQIDVWFSPLHRSYIPNIPIPTVVTIHDLLHTAYPQYVSDNLDWHNNYYQQFSPSFDAVITVSNFSKQTIIQNLQIPEEKIHVIYQDAPIGFERVLDEGDIGKIKEKYKLPDVFAIYPASYNPHKNHLNLLKAILSLRDHYNKEVYLVLTGYTYKGNIIFQRVLNFLKQHHLEKQVKILDYVPQNEMPFLYFHATFLLFPSLYEGFGIPLVEAMRAQCPIVCSNRGSIPEIVEEAALQFNPDNTDEIALQILKVLNPQTRQYLLEKSNERVKIFSWEDSAKETLEVFESVMQKGRK